jgi:hypothetical protein
MQDVLLTAALSALIGFSLLPFEYPMLRSLSLKLQNERTKEK